MSHRGVTHSFGLIDVQSSLAVPAGGRTTIVSVLFAFLVKVGWASYPWAYASFMKLMNMNLWHGSTAVLGSK